MNNWLTDGDTFYRILPELKAELSPRAPGRLDRENCQPGTRTCGVCLECRAEEADRMRLEHGAAAWAFLADGVADAGPSPDGAEWSRDYDPMPYKEALPDDLRMYEGTGVGALYGLPGSEVHAWQLAGWNLTGRSTA